jgi:hypothetical protein
METREEEKKRKSTHASGEKCATQLFTEMHVGNASPTYREREKIKIKIQSPVACGCKVQGGGGFLAGEERETKDSREPLETLTPLTDLLYTAPVPSSMNLSPSTQRSSTFAPSTDSSTSLFTATLTMSAAAYVVMCHRKIRKKRVGDSKRQDPRTLYLVMSASAVERGFSGVAGAGAVFPESDMIELE